LNSTAYFKPYEARNSLIPYQLNNKRDIFSQNKYEGINKGESAISSKNASSVARSGAYPGEALTDMQRLQYFMELSSEKQQGIRENSLNGCSS